MYCWVGVTEENWLCLVKFESKLHVHALYVEARTVLGYCMAVLGIAKISLRNVKVYSGLKPFFFYYNYLMNINSM